MKFPPEVMSAMIKVAGDWSIVMSKTPEAATKVLQPPQMSEFLENNFAWALGYLTTIVESHYTSR